LHFNFFILSLARYKSNVNLIITLHSQLRILAKTLCMRFYISFLVFIISLNIGAQKTLSSTTAFFGQCVIDINNHDEIRQLEADMRLNPHIKLVRLDVISKRVFILTKGIDVLTEENFRSWFLGYASKVRCVQIGLHGVDAINPYPFKGCEN
jgi:hypothetical protein